MVEIADASQDTSSDPPPQPPPAAASPAPTSEAALRVAYIVRSYLSLRQAGAASPSPSLPQARTVVAAETGDRCRAMMEVVRKEADKWRVSKLVVEHNHELSVAPGEENGAAVPVVGMEFDSVDAAKAFYYGYGEKLGFKPRTGSNRRSVGNGSLIMQRFLCSRGNYASRKNKEVKESKETKEAATAATGKRKRGPYKKKGRKAAKRNVEVIEVESSTEKGAVAGRENGREVRSRSAKRGALALRKRKKSGGEKDGDWIIGLEALSAGEGDGEDEMDGEKEKDGGKRKGRGKAKDREKGKVVTVAGNAQSRILRELGVRVSRYSNEERRKILNKYLTKRQSRPIPGRPAKIASRQALAERRKRGNGGRFLAREGPPPTRPPSERRSKRIEKQKLKKEEAKAASKEDEIIETEPDPPTEVVAGPGGKPKVGMVFLNEDKAYEFYLNYAGTVGFNIRKGWWEKTARSVTKSRSYVCSKEGFRPKNTTTDSKKLRPETRTGCLAHMTIKITASGKYAVTEFVADHNHDLEPPLMDIQILRSQKLLAKVQQPPEPPKVVLIPGDYKNYLRSKRTKDIRLGDAGAICEYLQKMKGDNPSFFYAIQVDEDDQLANIFWADAKSMMDYQYFGDVVCFDTRYSINEYGRPLALFIGVNHHKQPIIFGTALVYDESVESFRWLFETFKSAMCGKQPATVLTDHSTALADAIAAAWPGTTHRLSILHLYRNATTILSNVFEGSETFAHDLSRWLYDCEEEEFLSAWEMLLEKYNLKDNDWMGKLYEERERWALPYGRDTFCADIAGTLRNDNMDTILKEILKTETELPYFFSHYDKLVEEKRIAEQHADYLGTQMTHRVAPLRLLWQAANAYTPAVFEMFRLEFDLFLTCMVYSCGEIGTISEYEVTVKDKPRGHFVRFDSSECMVVCSCKKFESVGIPCCHMLKILDLRNVKELPPHYILKRWRKDAHNESLRENYGFAFDDDPKSSLSKRYSSLCRILYKIAAKAAENVEAYAFMENQSDQLLEQVELILQARLHDKSSLSATPKGHQPNLIQNEGSNSDSRRASVKKNKNTESRRRHQSPLESNKRKKGRQGLPEPEEAEAPLRVEPPPVSNDIPHHLRTPPNQLFAPSQLMQASFVPTQQFGLSSLQGFHGISQFTQMQESSAAPLQQPPLQQSPFHASTQIPQAPPPDMQSLQFLSSNPQLGHQNTDQGHYTIPVWDFL